MGDTDTTVTDIAASTGETATSSTGDVDIDTLIAQASTPDVTETPSTGEADTTETVEANPDDAAAAKTDDTQQPETDKTAPSDTEIDARRARKILADAKRQTAQAAQDFAALLKKNPRAALAKHGLSLEELIDADLADETPRVAKDEPKTDLEKRVEAAERKLALSEERAQQALLDSKIAAVKEGIKSDKSFELINRSSSHGDVLDFMQEYYNVHGAPIPWHKAAQLVEKDLRVRFGEPTPAKQTPVTAKSGNEQRQSSGAAPAKPAAAASTMTNSEVRTASPSDEEPTDPDQLIKFLVAKAERNSNQSH